MSAVHRPKTFGDMSKLVWLGVASVGMFFLVIMVALWTIYSMSEMVNSGTYTHHEAVSLVSRMALVTTGLAFSGIVIALLIAKSASPGRVALRNALVTGVVLAGYTALNVLWRERWLPNGGGAAFLPPWSELNARFFYEYNWLSYLLFLTPLAMILSGCISFSLAKLSSR
jgi:hypothetical protein